MTAIPMPLPSPVLCVITTRGTTGLEVESLLWVASFTEVDPEPTAADPGDGVPLVVSEHGLRTPVQHCHDLGLELVAWRLAWPQQQGSGLVIANGVPRLN